MEGVEYACKKTYCEKAIKKMYIVPAYIHAGFTFFNSCANLKLMVIRMRHTKGKRNRVRSHHALKPKVFSLCSHCKAEKLPHTVCRNCGYYNGRLVIDVLAKSNKKEAKKKTAEKEHTHAHN